MTTIGARLRSGALIAGGIAACAALGYALWLQFSQADKPKKRVVQQISLVKPPMPKKEEKPPEPEKVEQKLREEVRLQTPRDEPRADNTPAPGERLGLDADGAAGSDAFGLAANRGGRDITTLGPTAALGTGGGGRAGHGLYATQLQGVLQEELNRKERLRGTEYQAVVELWLTPEGRISRVELAGSSGDAELDRLLRTSLLEVTRLRAPPENLPLPVRIRITARGAG